MAKKLNSATSGRLVVIRQYEPEVVALVHAGLADNWERLSDWLRQDREFNTCLAEISEKHEKKDSLRSAKLTEAKSYLATRPDVPTDVGEYIRGHLRCRRWFRIALALVVIVAVTPPPALRGHTGIVFFTDLDPSGRLLATASRDRTTRLWDVRTPFQPLATINAHTNNVDAAVFGPHGTVLATASFDGTAILWDVSDPARPRRLSTLAGGHTTGIATAAFTRTE